MGGLPIRLPDERNGIVCVGSCQLELGRSPAHSSFYYSSFMPVRLPVRLPV